MNTDAGMVAAQAVQAVQAVQQAAPQAMEQAAQQAAQQGAQLTFVWWLPLLLAFVLVFSIEFVRALPFKKETLKMKPFTCDACMTGWAGVAVFILQLWAFGSGSWLLALLHTWPSLGLCILLLALKSYWKPFAPTES